MQNQASLDEVAQGLIQVSPRMEIPQPLWALVLGCDSAQDYKAALKLWNYWNIWNNWNYYRQSSSVSSHPISINFQEEPVSALSTQSS